MLIISLWLIPASLEALTPLKYGETLSILRSAVTIAMVTTISASALPFIIEATKQVARKCGIDDSQREDIARTNLSIAYPLGQLGNFFVYLFIIFAAYIFGKTISGVDACVLPFISLLSCFGSPTSSVNAVAFLGASLGLPPGPESLYVELMTIYRYGQVAASVMGFAFLSFTVVLAYYGKLKIRWFRLAGVLAAGALITFALTFCASRLYSRATRDVPNPYLSFYVDPALENSVSWSKGSPGDAADLRPGETIFARIERTGMLRVGFNPGIIPFCYYNSQGKLAGYDVAYAFKLAHDLKVKLRLIPFGWDDLQPRLEAGEFDIAMAGIYMTQERLIHVGVSAPYFQSPLALFTLRSRGGEFRTRDQIVDRRGLRLGVFDDPVLMPLLKNAFPLATIVTLPDYSTVPDFSKIDAAFWTLTQSEAMASAHPELVAVAPGGIGTPLMFSYLMPPNAEEFLRFINYWLDMKKSTGFQAAQQSYWIDRLPRPDPNPRWSILHNVLGVGIAQPHPSP